MSLFRTLPSIALSAISISWASSAWSAEQWAGDWTMTSISLQIDIGSWGENCGPKPASYSSRQTSPVKIKTDGPHLIFSKGGIRTDECGSPNPRLRTVSQKTGPGAWLRTCQTEDNDPKYERGEYSLSSVGENKLEYTAKSTFDWTLKGDHCTARSTEKRTYVRDTDARKKHLERENERDGTARGQDPEVLPQACERTGKAKRLSVHPHSIRIGPGERACFTAFAVDENGCKTEVKPLWTASQDGRSAGEMISKSGCFKAGDTAADSEGTYTVTAQSEGKYDSAEVTVFFPDLGELLAARLDPLEVVDTPEETVGETPSIPKPEAGLAPLPPAIKTGKSDRALTAKPARLRALALVFLGIILIGLIVGFFAHRKKKGTALKEKGPIKEKIEPDEEPEPASSKPDMGMVCPKCHRGYDSSARFCPHDSERLVPYSEWRITNR